FHSATHEPKRSRFSRSKLLRLLDSHSLPLHPRSLAIRLRFGRRGLGRLWRSRRRTSRLLPAAPVLRKRRVAFAKLVFASAVLDPFIENLVELRGIAEIPGLLQLFGAPLAAEIENFLLDIGKGRKGGFPFSAWPLRNPVECRAQFAQGEG